MKKLIIFLIATILLVIPAKKAFAAEQNNISAGTKESPAYEGTWLHDARSDTWTYAYTHPFKNTWAYVVNPWNDNKPAWFFFDENGTMLTGWQMIYWNGSIKYFYFHEASDGRRGECQLGGITPDGYTVNKDGAWTVNGVVQEYYPVSLSPSSSNGSAADAANAVPVASDAGGLYTVISQLSLPADDVALLEGGRRQRIAAGRAIVREPKVFLMDAPIGGIDAVVAKDALVRADVANVIGGVADLRPVVPGQQANPGSAHSSASPSKGRTSNPSEEPSKNVSNDS